MRTVCTYLLFLKLEAVNTDHDVAKSIHLQHVSIESVEPQASAIPKYWQLVQVLNIPNCKQQQRDTLHLYNIATKRDATTSQRIRMKVLQFT